MSLARDCSQGSSPGSTIVGLLLAFGMLSVGRAGPPAGPLTLENRLGKSEDGNHQPALSGNPPAAVLTDGIPVLTDDVPAPLPALRQAPRKALPEGAITRPQDSVPNPLLDAAWKQYDTALGQIAELVGQEIESLLAEEAKEGGDHLVAYWQCAKRRLDDLGELPRHQSCASTVARCRRTLAEESRKLQLEYKAVADALKVDGQHGLTERVLTELARLKAPPSQDVPAFDPQKFGLSDAAGIGATMRESWAATPAKNAAFLKRRGLPPHDGHGLLILELNKVHAKGLLKDDIVQVVDGVVLDSQANWEAIRQRLRVGQAAGVQIDRRTARGWKQQFLTVVPVSIARQNMVQKTQSVLPRYCKPVLRLDPTKPGDVVRLENIRANAAKQGISDEVISLAFDDPDGLFGLLTVAVASKDGPAIVSAFEAIGPLRVSSLTTLFQETDWGKLAAELDKSRTNGKVLLDAWKAVLDAFQ